MKDFRGEEEKKRKSEIDNNKDRNEKKRYMLDRNDNNLEWAFQTQVNMIDKTRFHMSIFLAEFGCIGWRLLVYQYAIEKVVLILYWNFYLFLLFSKKKILRLYSKIEEEYFVVIIIR